MSVASPPSVTLEPDTQPAADALASLHQALRSLPVVDAPRQHGGNMRIVNLTAGLAALAASLVFAASSQASTVKFIFEHGSTELPTIEGTRLFSGSEGGQSFSFGGIGVSCAVARGDGSGTSGAESQLDTLVKYEGCVTSGTLGSSSLQLKAVVKQPVEVVYSAGSFAELRQPFTIDIPAVKCTIDVSPLTLEEEEQREAEGLTNHAVYTNERVSTSKTKIFPSGFQTKIRIQTTLYAHYQLAGSCASGTPNTQGTGEYSGFLWDESKQADMSYFDNPGGGF
jgi:hypothetical protein